MGSHTLTPNQQRLMMLIYDNGFITKKDQTLYKSRFFYNKVGELIHKKFVSSTKDYSTSRNQYTLTERGIILVKILKQEAL